MIELLDILDEQIEISDDLVITIKQIKTAIPVQFHELDLLTWVRSGSAPKTKVRVETV